jgi:RHS repeat-associated protein
MIDHINTPRMITRAVDDRIVWRWDNTEPFGATPPEDNSSGLGVFAYNQRFPGQVLDRATGLVYNYFRDYDPVTGRYLQSDPIGLDGGINTYAYVGGNPVRYIDPLGLAGGPAIPIHPS